MTADARDGLEKIAARCAELSASQSGTEWLRGEIEKIGVMARDAARDVGAADLADMACEVMREFVGPADAIELRDRLRDANESQRRRENIEFCEQHGIAWQTVPSLARFIEPLPASVTESRVGSKSDASRQSPATTKKSRRAKTKQSPPAGSR